ncbi:methyltransferase domain-containing protein [Streptomyces smyrnaeus]|uniref:Arsenite methyltransferase n=2 Tax=Streptomyces smyrnaeus TaxID=1387713 RepID=A0ABS3Y3M8_9ACTN|nr:methyltransferase domain-containing protein [Streptomyces smyrnaeus]
MAAVRDYYGTVLASSSDLKTSACCTATAPPPHIAAALKQVHEEVTGRFYGCGTPIPPALDGPTVLDLGCGTGRDAYVLAQLVGARGQVIGVDMTEEQLAVARRHQGWHTEDYGQIAAYRGTLAEHPHVFELDDHHRFETGRPVPVYGNTADMLAATRYGQHFTVTGDKTTHFGLFPCAPGAAVPATTADSTAACC